MVLESWTGDGGLVGSSMNFYDSDDGRWHQVWVDAGGGVLRFDGSYADGALRYAGESALPDGGRQQERLTFCAAPRRAGSTNSGSSPRTVVESWTVVFDGTYVCRSGDVAATEPTPD